MKIRFLGAAGTVTGSRTLVSHGESRILVDCGLFQGFKTLRLQNREPLPVDPLSLDSVLLTHAHLDHSGALPLLAKAGYRGPIFATQSTIDLCRILLPDSGYLQEEEAKYANKRGYSKHHPALPLYTVEDAKKVLPLFRPVEWGVPVRVSAAGAKEITARFSPMGHLLGAASIEVRAGGKGLLFSGDVGREKDFLLRSPTVPDAGIPNLVLESTYGDRVHPGLDPESELKDIILKTHRRGGTLLVPSFAVGRAQLILYFVHRLRRSGAIPLDLPVYLNSPMAAEANKVFAAHADELLIDRAEFQKIWEFVRIVSTVEESKALNERHDPAIIIAASGMATGGRVLHHLKTLAPFQQNTILFVGFQAEGTRGDLLTRGIDEIKIHGEAWPVRAEVLNMSTLSAHADRNELLRWVSRWPSPPHRVFCNHGNLAAAESLSAALKEKLGVEAVVPNQGDEFEL